MIFRHIFVQPRSITAILLGIFGTVAVLPADEFVLNGYTLKVPDGFTVESAVADGLVKYPICGAFDDRGRLYVCESSGVAEWHQPQPPETRHRLLRLEDSNGDGIFDRRTVFAELEMIPHGVIWLDGSIYTAAPPVIWKLTDTSDDGVADIFEEWVDVKNTTGCLNDLRGPYLGRDGLIYWCKGPSQQQYTRAGQPWTTDARHILRRAADGSDVESLMTSGADNLVEIAFGLGGDRFVTGTYFHQLGQPREDGIIHAIYGGVYAKDLAPIYEFPWTGPDLIRPMTTWGALSPAGLMCYESTAFGDDFRGNLFSALFTGNKVMRHVLTPQGGSYACRDEDFLTCDNVEFHATEVMEDADGSLLVFDTGGWYLKCCPSSTFYRPDSVGSIYRVRKQGAHRVQDPRGLQITHDALTFTELSKLLADPRPVVRDKAVDQLAKRGSRSVSTLRQVVSTSEVPTARLAAVWSASRIEHPGALEVIRMALLDTDSTVRRAALNNVCLRRDTGAKAVLLDRLQGDNDFERRLAAEALGRLGDPDAVAALLNALKLPMDRNVEHSLIYALIEIADESATRTGLAAEHPQVRRGALIALDQMGVKLDPDLVLAELNAEDDRLKDAAWWIVSRHARQWGGLLADRLSSELTQIAEDTDQQEELKRRLASLMRSPELSEWVVNELTATGVSATSRMLLLRAMGDSGGQYADPVWVESLLRLIETQNRDRTMISEVIGTLAKLPPLRVNSDSIRGLSRKLSDNLLAVARDIGQDDEVRVRAISAVRGSLGHLDDELFDFLLMQLAPQQPHGLRSSAAEAIARSRLTDQQMRRLSGGLKNLALSELSTVLGVFEGNTDSSVGERLVSSLSVSPAAERLNAFRLQSLLAGYGTEVSEKAGPLFDRLQRSQAEQLAKAERIVGMMETADPTRGIQVFRSEKAACTSCHKAANIGSEIGPHLRGIGGRRTERDLIESILFPSASLVQSYATWIVATADGQVFSGVLVEDRPDEIVLSAGADKTYRIARVNIDEMVRSDQSIMPEGIDKLLTDHELADLISYLKSL